MNASTNAFLERLWGLDELATAGAGVEWALARPLPAWGWLLVAAAAVALAAWSYRRLMGPLWARAGLAGLRVLLLLLLVLLICGPQLVRPDERVERDWVVLLVDRSASMQVPDAPGPLAAPGAGAGDRQSRDEQLRRSLDAAWPALGAMFAGRNVLTMGFDGAAFDLAGAGATSPPALGPPQGRQTALGRALEQALERVAARPLAGVIVASDGRSVDEPSRRLLRRLATERVPILAVPLGSPDPITDLRVAGVDAPALAFINDTLPVQVQVERLGPQVGPDASAADGARVQLIDAATGLILDERPIDPAAWSQGRASLTLTSAPADAGKRLWTVRVLPQGPDLIAQNNAAQVAVEFVDRPLRILYLDGTPRWEYRYLKNLLLRERSIRSGSLLLSPDRQFIAEGEPELLGVPRSPQDWANIDVVILGDVNPGMFTAEQLRQLRDHVGQRGAGLLWIGGASHTPTSWRATPLADLLPFALGGDTGTDDPGAGTPVIRTWPQPVLMQRQPAAERLGVLILGDDPAEPWPARLTDPRTGWSLLYGAQRIDPSALKPTAELLASAIPADQAGEPLPLGSPTTVPPGKAAPRALGAPWPLVMTMRYGAGRVLYVATDETWRWRYARGEALSERFWLPLLRLQGRESLARSARAGILEAAPRRAEVARPVRFTLRLVDQSLADGAPSTISLRLTRNEDRDQIQAGGSGQSQSLSLVPERATGGGETVAGGGKVFGGTWLAAAPGTYKVEPADAVLAAAVPPIEVEVALADDELRRPQTDHPLLARIAEQTGGVLLPPDRLGEAPNLLPNRELRVAGVPQIEPLWDKPIVLAIFLFLVTLEWVGRRLIKLS